MFVPPSNPFSVHLSPYHPYTSLHHATSPLRPHFHSPNSPTVLSPFHLDTDRKRHSTLSVKRKLTESGSEDPIHPLKRTKKTSPLSRSCLLFNHKGTPVIDLTPIPTIHIPSSTMDQFIAHSQSSLTNTDMSSNQHAILPPVMSMKRANPKRLSLTLTMPTASPPSIATPLSITPTSYSTDASTESTPYTPGPPKTPALATASLGRITTKGLRRPSLLSLITQPTDYNDVPPTPGGGGSVPYFNCRPPLRLRARASTEVYEVNRVCPSYKTFPPINEHDAGLPTFGSSYQSSSSDTSPHTSASASTASTPSSSPPLPSFTHALFPRPEPYQDGPVEIVPNVFLGAEDSATELSWARRFKSIRIINVAQELEDPFASPNTRGKRKVAFGQYESVNGYTDIEYCHLRWSHGESGLADLPPGAKLSELMVDPKADLDADSWGIWNAVKWLEEARREGRPVLVHCQCGISRSATLIIAYLMCLAASGLMPEHLGHLSGMQETYDMVKNKSPCIGPNVSLVFQLVELQRALTVLLSEHVELNDSQSINTSFPTLAAQAESEAEWARKRAEFEEEERNSIESDTKMWISPASPEEAGDEARRLDEAMLMRLKQRN